MTYDKYSEHSIIHNGHLMTVAEYHEALVVKLLQLKPNSNPEDVWLTPINELQMAIIFAEDNK